MSSLFVTSSGTEIGKTHVCCGLVAALRKRIRVRCIKPVVTGLEATSAAESDTARLLAAQGRELTPDNVDATSPWRFVAPLSADMAAAREGTQVPFDALVEFSRPQAGFELNMIEGIGGVMAPLNHQHTVLDWIGAIDARPLLVVGSYLGSLSHTLTAVAALKQRDRTPIAIVISQSIEEPVAPEESAASVMRFCGDLPVHIIRRDEAADYLPLLSLVRQEFGLS